MNYGMTPEELKAGRPIIGITQIGSDLSPCNRVHVELAKSVRDGIRDAGPHREPGAGGRRRRCAIAATGRP